MAIKWDIDISELLRKRVIIETREGFIIKGKLTKVEFKEFNLMGKMVGIPVEVVLDGTDPVQVANILKLEREQKT